MDCPVCRRHIETNLTCPRCGVELSTLLQLKETQQIFLNYAQKKLEQQKFDEALKYYVKASKIINSAETKKGLFVTLVALGEYSKAMKYY